PTQILAGSVFVTSAGQLGLNSAMTVNGTLELANSAQTAKNLTGSSSGFINLLGLPTTFTVTQSANTTFAGVITGSGGALVLGVPSTGTLTLSGANAYGGNTSVSGGLTLDYSSVGSNVLYGASGAANGNILTLTGGALTLLGKAGTVSSQST